MARGTPPEPTLSALVVPPSRREQILRTAATLFADAGFATVTMTDIGSACGISGPALYHHFASKEAMLGEMLVSISEHLLRSGRDLVAENQEPVDALRALIDGHADFATSRRELITVQFRDLVHASQDDQRTVRRLQRRYVELWVDTIVAAAPAIEASIARTAVHAAFGLLNSTAHSSARTGLLAEFAWRLLEPAALLSLGQHYRPV